MSCFTVLNAQDVIVQNNGEEIKAKVTEVNIEDVKYKRFGNESGPTYTLSKSDIFMIKYENGEKDLFNTNDKPDIQEQASSQAVKYTVEEEIYQEDRRKGYVGIAIGGASLLEDYSNADSGVQFTINFGYLFSEHVGITASFFGTSYELSNYTNRSVGLGGLLAGPLFSSTFNTKKFEFDLRPTIGFATKSISKSGSSESAGSSFAFGAGTSVRWNCASRVSISANIDYIYGSVKKEDLSSVGFSVGVNFRF
ncbi:porin family protein [Bacteroidales bacterium OttesenSCG-928-I14]|nr:porin family protein [Bacteroidales bacterium OttesenSCG-928-I14]